MHTTQHVSCLLISVTSPAQDHLRKSRLSLQFPSVPNYTVTCLALIGRSPSHYTPILPYTVSLHCELASDHPGVWRSADAVPSFFGARILLKILHDVIQTLT